MANIHVVTHNNKWAIRKEHASRVTKILETQQEAIKEGRAMAQHQRAELYVHGKDGQIRLRNTYKHDPYPPRG